MRYRIIAAALLALAGTSLPALGADRVELSDGRILVGNLTKMDRRVAVIETQSGTVRVSADSVRSVRAVEGDAEKTARAESARNAAERREAAGRKAASPPQKRPRTGPPDAEQLALFSACRKLLASKRAVDRGDAMDRILANWPATALFLDSALRDENEAVRVDATRLLGEEKIDEVANRLRPRLRDRSPSVRLMAARVVRRRKLAQFERQLASLVRNDNSKMVRQEALRSLEEVATLASARSLLETWANTEDDRVKRRARLALARVLGTDHRDDSGAWLRAVEAAELAARTVSGAGEANQTGAKERDAKAGAPADSAHAFRRISAAAPAR